MQTSQPWWETFFSGLVLQLPPMYSEEHSQADADFLVQTLAPAPGARILDVPCGSGRIALALAARGFNLVGVDSTAASVEQATRAAQERNLSAQFEQRDMRDLPANTAFDHAYCFGNSFGYFPPDQNAAFLSAVHQALKPGGKFVLETGFVAEAILTQPLGRRWYPCGDMYFLHETRYDPPTGRLTSDYVFFKDGEIERKQAIYQTYAYRELVRLFQEVGFTTVAGYGSRKCEPFQLGNHQVWLVGER